MPKAPPVVQKPRLVGTGRRAPAPQIRCQRAGGIRRTCEQSFTVRTTPEGPAQLPYARSEISDQNRYTLSHDVRAEDAHARDCCYVGGKKTRCDDIGPVKSCATVESGQTWIMGYAKKQKLKRLHKCVVCVFVLNHQGQARTPPADVLNGRRNQ